MNIKFCKIGDESSSINGIIQDEPLEYQGIGNGGFILRTRMEHTREYIVKCRDQILKNQEIVSKVKSRLDVVAGQIKPLQIRIDTLDYTTQELNEILTLISQLRMEKRTLTKIMDDEQE